MCWLFFIISPPPPQTCKKFSHLDGIFCLKYSRHEHRNSELHTFNEFWVLGQSWHYHRLVGGAWEVVHPSFHLVVDEFWWVTLGNSPLHASCQQPWRWRQRPVLQVLLRHVAVQSKCVDRVLVWVSGGSRPEFSFLLPLIILFQGCFFCYWLTHLLFMFVFSLALPTVVPLVLFLVPSGVFP